ncbi:hypothetical protein AAD018_003035 [Aestuariibius insulae]|uniref:hypothetical protein n=1 Tax=Aestuariibius insulae TaxID=2058287 RepID=UPI00345E31F1
MTRSIAAALALLTLAACGADGAPEPPTYQQTRTYGPNVSIGIDSRGNTDVGASIGLGRGPVTVFVGL